RHWPSFEPVSAPADIDIESFNFSAAHNGRIIRSHVTQPSPLAEQTHFGQGRHQAQHIGGKPFVELQAAAHRIRSKWVHTGAKYQLTTICLTHIYVQCSRYHHGAQKWFDRFGHCCLQGRGGDRQLHAGHIGDEGRPTSSAVNRSLSGANAHGGTDPCHFATIDVDASDFGVLDDVNTHFVCGASIPPHHGVVTNCPTRWVVERAEYWISGIFGNINIGHQLVNLVWTNDL